MQYGLFPGPGASFDFKEVNQTIDYGGYAHACRAKQRIQPSNKEAVVLSYSANDVSNEGKWIQANGKMD